MRITFLLILTALSFAVPAYGNEPDIAPASVKATECQLDELLDFEKVDKELEEERFKKIHEIFKNRTGRDLIEDEISGRIEIA